MIKMQRGQLSLRCRSRKAPLPAACSPATPPAFSTHNTIPSDPLDRRPFTELFVSLTKGVLVASLVLTDGSVLFLLTVSRQDPSLASRLRAKRPWMSKRRCIFLLLVLLKCERNATKLRESGAVVLRKMLHFFSLM